MISSFFGTTVYDPLYNGLVFFVGVVPAHDMGLAIIALTVVMRVIIYPLSRRSIEAQMAMKKVAPEVEELKKKYKKNSPEQSQAILAFYREKGIRPFASIGLVLVQFPVLIGLYWVFYSSGFPSVDTDILYPFIHAPEYIKMEFLGLVDMGSRSIVIALLAGVTQFIYTRLSMGPRPPKPAVAAEPSLSGDLARSFDLQMRYALPVLIGVIGFTIASAAPLYWAVSNVFMIAQELLMGRRFSK